jgi:hypothetical protein
MVKDSFTLSKHSQDANKSQNVTRDDVLKRMLKMRPQPHKSKKFEADEQLDFADSEDSASDISDRNEKAKDDLSFSPAPEFPRVQLN